MSARSLRNYVEKRNRFRILFGKSKPLPYPTNFEEAKPFFAMLSTDLSPENLHCDGEISPSAARRKYDRFMKCWRELEKISRRRVSEDEAFSFYGRF